MKIIDSKSLGEAIRIRRKELKYTQAYIAEFTGFSEVLFRIWKEVRLQQKSERQLQLSIYWEWIFS